jgi:DNA-binding GntR family transcriptional regulator
MADTEAAPDLEHIWQANGSSVAASDGAYATLREAIVLGRLKAGDRLAEGALARTFGISRTPVREACLRLEAERLATRIPRRGLVVRTFSQQDILDFFSVRAVLEGLAASHAAERAQAADIAQLRWINRQLAEAVDAGATPKELDGLTQQFHRALYRAARNSLLLEFMNQINERISGFQGSTFSSPGWAQQVVADHDAVIVAIEAGRADEAEQLARKHKLSAQAIRLGMPWRGAAERS